MLNKIKIAAIVVVAAFAAVVYKRVWEENEKKKNVKSTTHFSDDVWN